MADRQEEPGRTGSAPRAGAGQANQNAAGDRLAVNGTNAASTPFTPPAITLPKGGGAIRGIGEKFAANPVTGTGVMSVPIATSPGRSGFGPQLSLSYDSGAGNGPFGFGWSLSLPQITRKTDKGLPQYDDAAESDVFILSGSEDLVPVYRQDLDGTWVAAHPGYQRDDDGFWVRDPAGHLIVHEDELDGYCIRRYRPRIEGLFARIERWTKIDTPTDVHWRSISRDNILTLYGKDVNSRIADPDPALPGHIFTWLICETRDDKGNGLLYNYQPEDQRNLKLDRAHEANRTHRGASRYLKQILYGNRVPLLVGGRRPAFLTPDQVRDAGWMFEVVFDYDEGHLFNETIAANGQTFVEANPAPTKDWEPRNDPFSSYRAGFEVRTYRLCQRVLMFHHIPDMDQSHVGYEGLVRSTDFNYAHEDDPADVRNPIYSFLRSVTQSGYTRQGTGATHLKRSLPPVEFEYTQPIVQASVQE